MLLILEIDFIVLAIIILFETRLCNSQLLCTSREPCDSVSSFIRLKRLSWNWLRIHLVILLFRFLERACSFALSTYILQFIYRFSRLGIKFIFEKPCLLARHKSRNGPGTVGSIAMTTLLCSKKALNLRVWLRLNLLNAVFLQILGTSLSVAVEQICWACIFKRIRNIIHFGKQRTIPAISCLRRWYSLERQTESWIVWHASHVVLLVSVLRNLV